MSAISEAGAAQSPASGSSFYAAMRLMPKPQREAMFAIYGFCRKVDDIADEPGPTMVERRAALQTWRDRLAQIDSAPPPTCLADLVEPRLRYGLRTEDFLAIVDGMEMDVEQTICAPPYATLDLYCDRVASAVGRLSVRVFGMDEEPGVRLAHDLGRALQLTNILRDIDEDAAMGRLYLPAEALSAARIETTDPAAVLEDARIDDACRWLAARAHEHYCAADGTIAGRPAGNLRTPALMSAVYAAILGEMERIGWLPPRRRIRLGKGRLAWLILTRGLI